MAVPLDEELYDKVKQMANKIYKKSSAYKSAFIIKKYKELGGEFVDYGERKLKRWFDEKWTDVNPNKTENSYPVFRPTVRINKFTPLTVDEINYNNLIKQSDEKQRIKGNKNLKPFIGKGINNMLLPAVKTPKSDDIWNFSNPIQAQKKAYEYLGDEAHIYRSFKPDKKYMIYDPENEKWVYFGQMGYEDYLHHKNFDRMQRYRARATNMKGEWRDNPYSANNLSINILW